MIKKSTQSEVDGDKLRAAREAQGITTAELARRLCLSHRHITQLESNQLAIFFSHAHKIQVANKVGEALGLIESDFLSYQGGNKNLPQVQHSSQVLRVPNRLIEAKEDQPKVNQKSKFLKRYLFVIPAIAVSCIAVGAVIRIYPNELVALNLSKTSQELLGYQSSTQTNTSASAPTDPELNPVASIDAATYNPLETIEQMPCSFQNQEAMPYHTINPSKQGDMVYVLSKEPQTVCVIDGQNKAVSLDLDIGQSQSVYGQAPFTIISSDLSKLDLYFQGWKVKTGSIETKAIRLEATELAVN